MRLVACGVWALLFSGCAAVDNSTPIATATELNRSLADAKPTTYVLGVGDEVALTVYGEPDLTRNYKIGPDGSIELPLIGRVQAAGMTVGALSSEVQARLASGYLRNPSVAGAIVTFRPFFILGEVNKPGEYPYQEGLTLTGAVAVAGGYTYRAQTRYVFIRGEKTNQEVRVIVSPDLVVRPGDTIRVDERYF